MNKLPRFLVVLFLLTTSLFGQSKVKTQADKTRRPFYRMPSENLRKPFYRGLKPLPATGMDKAIATAIGPAKATLLLDRAHNYLAAGIESGFQRDLNRALELEPDNDEIVIGATHLLMERADIQKCDQVVEITTGYISRHSQSDAAYDARSQARVCLGDFVGAFDDISIAIEITPRSFSDHRSNRSGILRKIADPNLALALHQKVIDDLEAKRASEKGLNYKNFWRDYLAVGYIERAFVYKRIGDVKSEISDLSKAVDLIPEWCLRFRATAYKSYKMYAEALADLSQSISLLKPDKIRGNRDDFRLYLDRAET